MGQPPPTGSTCKGWRSHPQRRRQPLTLLRNHPAQSSGLLRMVTPGECFSARQSDDQFAKLHACLANCNGFTALGKPVDETVGQVVRRIGEPCPSTDLYNRTTRRLEARCDLQVFDAVEGLVIAQPEMVALRVKPVIRAGINRPMDKCIAADRGTEPH